MIASDGGLLLPGIPVVWSLPSDDALLWAPLPRLLRRQWTSPTLLIPLRGLFRPEMHGNSLKRSACDLAVATLFLNLV